MQDQKASFLLDRVKEKHGIRFDKDLAILLKVGSSDIGNWRRRGEIPKRYLKKVEEYLKGGYNEEIPIDYTKGDTDMEARYIIELQKDKIEHQNLKISELEETVKNKQAESTHWDQLQFDFIVKLKLKRTGFKFSRVITSVDDLSPLSVRTGYTESELREFWAVKREYGIFCDDNPHPINNIIAEESEREIESLGKSLPYIFDSLKHMVGNHYIPVPIAYKHKDGNTKIQTLTYNKINWVKMTIHTKVKFLGDSA
tara:strand:- start:1247 stop:2011 length:765 start_codon:yes stop_codon:yes gene_type:complete